MCIHTTGRTVGQRALADGEQPIDRILRLYAHGNAWPHFVVDTDGTVWQTAALNSRAAHAGIASAQRARYAPIVVSSADESARKRNPIQFEQD